jgi:polyisoprenoid-binding protein YceI
MSATDTETRAPFWLSGRTWRLDRGNSKFEFQVRHFWGLITVSGRFQRFDASLETNDDGTAQMSVLIDAASLDTGNAKRDQHLRSADFFDADNHPVVRFTSTSVTHTNNGRINVSGELEAAGKRIPLAFDAGVHELADGDIALEAKTVADHRQFGMTWSPLGMLLAPAILVANARLSERPDLPA